MEAHKKINLLILGGTKFIGKNLINSIPKRKFRIDVLSRKKYLNKKINKLYQTELKYFEKFIEKKNYDYIFDFISKDQSLLKKIFLKVKFKKYIFISSVWINKLNINSKLDKPIKKIMSNIFMPNITKRYLLNKYRIENFIIKNSLKKKNKFYILRLPIILGNQDKTKRLQFYVKRALDLKGQIILKENIILNLLWVKDLCLSILKLIKKNKWPESSFIEALNTSNISYKNFIKIIYNECNIKKKNFFYLKKKYLCKNFKKYFYQDPFINEIPLIRTNNNIFKITNYKPSDFKSYIKNLSLEFDNIIDKERIREINFLKKIRIKNVKIKK